MSNQNLKKGMEWFLAWQQAFKGKDEMEAAYYVVGELLAYCVNLEERLKQLESIHSVVSLEDMAKVVKSSRTINAEENGE